MKRRPLPIRWRLTFWYGAILAVSFALLGAGLYVGLRKLMVDSFNEQLNNQIELVASAVQRDSNQLVLDQQTLNVLGGDERFVRLFNSDGAMTLDTSASVGGAPLDAEAVQAALAGRVMTETRRLDDAPFGIATKPLREGGLVVGALQVGVSSEDIQETLDLMLLALLIATPIALALATAGGYVVAGRTLAPVSEITSHAAGIGANDLHARLNLNLPNDELGRLARTFDSMLSRIEEQFERQKRFTGDAAHELRTPVAAMRGEVDLALSRPRSVPEYRSALEQLDQDLERVTGLLSSLLLLSRADDQHLALERTRFDLADTIAAVVEQYGSAAGERGIELRNDAVSCPVYADTDLIIQVLVNLVENALAHTPEGGVVTIGCRPGTGTSTLWVEDTGSGIAPEHIPRIFDRFYRVDEGRSRDRGGAGLGLSICRAIVDAHAGTISLTSTPDKGTRVEIVFPV